MTAPAAPARRSPSAKRVAPAIADCCYRSRQGLELAFAPAAMSRLELRQARRAPRDPQTGAAPVRRRIADGPVWDGSDQRTGSLALLRSRNRGSAEHESGLRLEARQ